MGGVLDGPFPHPVPLFALDIQICLGLSRVAEPMESSSPVAAHLAANPGDARGKGT